MMTGLNRVMSPQIGLAAFALVAATTLYIDAQHALPVVQRWIQAHESSVPHVRSFRDLDVAIETASGERTSLAATNGRVRIATMFYAHCPTMCPLIVDTLQRIDTQLTLAERQKLGVLMVSLDPTHDSPSAMKAFAAERRIDTARWTLARTAASDVGHLAQTLGIAYDSARTDVQPLAIAHDSARTSTQPLGNAAASSAKSPILKHSPVLVLLDTRGNEVARSESLGAPDAAFIAAIRQALADART